MSRQTRVRRTLLGSLAHLDLPTHPDLLVGISTGDDAGVFRFSDDLAIVNTVDFFTPVVDDPFTYGQISATNALSDVYAMGGVPRTALNIVCWPQTGLPGEMLAEILRGAAEKAREAGVVIVGGHTVADEEVEVRHGDHRRDRSAANRPQRRRASRRCDRAEQGARHRNSDDCVQARCAPRRTLPGRRPLDDAAQRRRPRLRC